MLPQFFAILETTARNQHNDFQALATAYLYTTELQEPSSSSTCAWGTTKRSRRNRTPIVQRRFTPFFPVPGRAREPDATRRFATKRVRLRVPIQFFFSRKPRYSSRNTLEPAAGNAQPLPTSPGTTHTHAPLYAYNQPRYTSRAIFDPRCHAKDPASSQEHNSHI